MSAVNTHLTIFSLLVFLVPYLPCKTQRILLLPLKHSGQETLQKTSIGFSRTSVNTEDKDERQYNVKNAAFLQQLAEHPVLPATRTITATSEEHDYSFLRRCGLKSLSGTDTSSTAAQPSITDNREYEAQNYPLIPLKVWVWSSSQSKMKPYRLWFQEIPRPIRLKRAVKNTAIPEWEKAELDAVDQSKTTDEFFKNMLALAKNLFNKNPFSYSRSDDHNGVPIEGSGDHIGLPVEGSVGHIGVPIEGILRFGKRVTQNNPFLRKVMENLMMQHLKKGISEYVWNRSRRDLPKYLYRSDSTQPIISSSKRGSVNFSSSQSSDSQVSLKEKLPRHIKESNIMKRAVRVSRLEPKEEPKNLREKRKSFKSKKSLNNLHKKRKSTMHSETTKTSHASDVLDLSEALNVGKLSDVRILNTSLLSFENRHAAILVFPIIFSNGCPKADKELGRSVLGYTDNGWWLVINGSGKTPMMAYLPKDSVKHGQDVDEVKVKFDDVLQSVPRQSRDVITGRTNLRSPLRFSVQVLCSSRRKSTCN